MESFFGQFCINPNKQYNFNDAISEHIDEYGILGSRTKGVTDTDIWKNHKPAECIKNSLGSDIFNKYLKFCVIRNPYDKMVSYYFFKKTGESFKTFAKNNNVNDLHIHGINEVSVCDFYIRYENLKEDIIKLCTILNIDKYDINDLPTHKSHTRPKNISYRDYYDDETRNIVYQNHKKEIEIFGYEF